MLFTRPGQETAHPRQSRLGLAAEEGHGRPNDLGVVGTSRQKLGVLQLGIGNRGGAYLFLNFNALSPTCEASNRIVHLQHHQRPTRD